MASAVRNGIAQMMRNILTSTIQTKSGILFRDMPGQRWTMIVTIRFSAVRIDPAPNARMTSGTRSWAKSFAKGPRPDASSCAVWRAGGTRVPVGGASYWQVLPTALVLGGLERAGSYAGLYLHPNELDPQPLKAMLPRGATTGQRAHARLREAQRNGARRRAPGVLRAIARRFDLIPYGEAHARLGNGS